jgi:large conductance mechanosensitive channel
MSMLSDFKSFATRGNVVDLAVGFILGTAFGKIITSLVSDIIMPPIGLALGRVDFSNLFIDMSSKSYPTLAAAKAAGAPTINYGIFVNTVIDFLIVSFAMFILVRQFERLMPPAPAPAAPATRDCPYCLSKIPPAAQKCAYCTSEVRAA